MAIPAGYLTVQFIHMPPHDLRYETQTLGFVLDTVRVISQAEVDVSKRFVTVLAATLVYSHTLHHLRDVFVTRYLQQ